MKELAKKVGLDKSGISRGVEELVRKGYVNREASKEDRRCVVLSLTEAGQARFEKIENDMYGKFAGVFANIAEDKLQQVLEALKIYNAACRKTESK